jgi:SAM-dependent methyltransferase
MATRRIEIAPENQDQFAAWNGEEGEQWAADAEFFDAAIHHIHRRLMDAAAIRSDEQVLDIGCGTGQCTHDAARQARKGAAIGIDLSLPLLHVAETIAGRDGLANATFEQGDAQIFPFPDAAFDVALSRMGAMFFADQAAAFTNIAKAMRPGGRLLLISWRAAAENEWITQLREAMLPGAPAPEPPGDAPTPFRHADQHTTKVILEASGFDTVAFEPVTAPMFFGGDAEAGFPVLCRLLGWMVRDLEPDAARRAYRRLHTLLRDHETTDGVAFGSAFMADHRPPPSRPHVCDRLRSDT